MDEPTKTQDFILGQIVARLNSNDQAHIEIKSTLDKIFSKLDSNAVEVTTLKTTAKHWGLLAGFVGSLFLLMVELGVKLLWPHSNIPLTP